jgi:hypothetical protein
VSTHIQEGERAYYLTWHPTIKLVGSPAHHPISLLQHEMNASGDKLTNGSRSCFGRADTRFHDPSNFAAGGTCRDDPGGDMMENGRAKLDWCEGPFGMARSNREDQIVVLLMWVMVVVVVVIWWVNRQIRVSCWWWETEKFNGRIVRELV